VKKRDASPTDHTLHQIKTFFLGTSNFVGKSGYALTICLFCKIHIIEQGFLQGNPQAKIGQRVTSQHISIAKFTKYVCLYNTPNFNDIIFL
jgi:hypothetical protein